MYVILIASSAPAYFVNRLGIVFFPLKNRTLIALVRDKNRDSVEKPTTVINNIVTSFLAFLVIVVCTVTLVTKLRSKANWRKTSTNVVQADRTVSRDAKVTKMVVFIAVLFIACFTPVCVNFIAMNVVKDFTVDGKYKNTNLVTMGTGFLLESINSATNIFIYYNMSSKYKDTFWLLFTFRGGKKEF